VRGDQLGDRSRYWLRQAGWQQVRCQHQITGGTAVVETQRVPGFRPVAELHLKTVFKETDVGTVEEGISRENIKLAHIGLLGGDRRGSQEQGDGHYDQQRPQGGGTLH